MEMGGGSDWLGWLALVEEVIGGYSSVFHFLVGGATPGTDGPEAWTDLP